MIRAEYLVAELAPLLERAAGSRRLVSVTRAVEIADPCAAVFASRLAADLEQERTSLAAAHPDEAVAVYLSTLLPLIEERVQDLRVARVGPGGRRSRRRAVRRRRL